MIDQVHSCSLTSPYQKALYWLLSGILALMAALPALAAPQSLCGYPIATRLTAPSGHAITSFDSAGSTLYFMTGDPFYNPGLTVWQYDGATAAAVFSNPGVFAGSKLTVINGIVYFNDGGDFVRWTYDYFRLNPDLSVTQVLDSTTSVSLWEAEAGPDGALYASGADGFGPSRIYRTLIDGIGGFGPFAMLGEVGDASGPLAFRPDGGMCYVPGYYYAGPPVPIYAFTAAEVTAAIADPSGSLLDPAGHDWGTLPAPFTGASGAVTDAYGRLYVTANAWGEPGRLLMYQPQGGAPVSIAEEPAGRMETIRIESGKVVFNTADGIHEMPLPLAVTNTGGSVEATAGDPVTLSVQTDGGAGPFTYQWYRVADQKAAVPVGDNLPYFTFTPAITDDGSRFYCEVSDTGFTVNSPEFILQVSQPTPAGGTALILMLFLLGGVAALLRTSRA